MSRTIQKLLALCLTTCVLWPATLPAAENVLGLIPHDMLGAAIIDNPSALQGKLEELAKQLQLPLPDLVALARQRSGVGDGLDPHGSVAVAAVAPADGRGGPVWVWYVATSDYPKLLKSLSAEQGEDQIAKAMISGRPSVIASKGGYAVIAEAKNQPALEHVLASQHSLADDMAALSQRVAKADAYVVAAPAGIKMAQTQLLAGLDMVKAQVEQQSPQEGANVAAGLALYETMFRAMDKELSHLMIGGKLEQDGAIRIVTAASLNQESTLAQIGRSMKPVARDLLAGLPSGPFVFAGGGVLPPGLGEQLMGWSMGMMKQYFGGAKISEDDLKKLTEMGIESMRGMRAMSMVMGNAAPGAPMYENTMFAIRIDDAQAYLANYEKSIQSMGEILGKSDNPPFDYKVNMTSHDGRQVLEFQADMSRFVQGQALPQSQQMMKLMFGEGGKLTLYLAVLDKQTVIGQYVSKERLLERLKGGPSAEALERQPEVAKTLGMLPRTAQGIALWSPRGSFVMVRQMMQTLQPGGAIPLPEFPASPPIGFALEILPQRLDIELVMPAELIQAIAQFAQEIRQSAAGRP